MALNFLQMDFLTRFEPWLRSILRIMAAFTFSEYGWQKFLGLLGGFGRSGQPADPNQFPLLYFAGGLETVGGALLMLGLFTRPVAFLLSGEMAVAYFRTHAPRGFWPLLNGGEPAVFYAFAFLYLAAAGAGPLSLDRLLGRKN